MEKTTAVVFDKDELIELKRKGTSHIPYEKTSKNFLDSPDYTIPKYSTYQSGSITCHARRETYLPGFSSSLTLSIGDIVCANFDSVTKEETLQSYSGDFTDGCITNTNNYLVISGNAKWEGHSPTSFYIKNPTIELTYICPKFTISLETNDSAMGTVTFDDGSSSKEFDVTKKGWTETTTITATPNDGYFFIKWDDDDKGKEGPSRKIALAEADPLAEANLESSNTILTYKAIFGKKELYVGSKRLDAIYVGTKKAKVYRGSTRIL